MITTFNDFKLKRTSFRFLVMKIEKNEVVLEKGVDKVDSATWYDDFCAEYLKDTPAYVAIDFDYKTTDGRDAHALQVALQHRRRRQLRWLA